MAKAFSLYPKGFSPYPKVFSPYPKALGSKTSLSVCGGKKVIGGKKENWRQKRDRETDRATLEKETKQKRAKASVRMVVLDRERTDRGTEGERQRERETQHKDLRA